MEEVIEDGHFLLRGSCVTGGCLGVCGAALTPMLVLLLRASRKGEIVN